MESRRKKFKSIPKRKPVGETVKIATDQREQNKRVSVQNKSAAVQNVSGAAVGDNKKLNVELKRLRAEVANLKKKNKKLVTQNDKNLVKSEPSSSRDPIKHYERLPPKVSNWYGEIPDSDGSLEFETEYPDESQDSEMESDDELEGFPDGWRKLVNSKPEISWSIEQFERRKNYQKVFTLSGYSARVYVDGDTPNIKVKLTFDEEAVWVPKPSIIAIIRATKADWVDAKVVERCFTKSKDSSSRFDYKTTKMKETFYSGCVTFNIEIYIELPWTIREIQSKSGVLSWIIEDFHDVFGNENSFMKSPEFSAPPTSFRMHAELSSSELDDCLILKVKVRDGKAIDWQTEDYLIVVTVLRPNSDGIKKRIYTKMSRLREGATFNLGELDDIVDVNSIFICKVKIVFG